MCTRTVDNFLVSMVLIRLDCVPKARCMAQPYCKSNNKTNDLTALFHFVLSYIYIIYTSKIILSNFQTTNITSGKFKENSSETNLLQNDRMISTNDFSSNVCVHLRIVFILSRVYSWAIVYVIEAYIVTPLLSKENAAYLYIVCITRYIFLLISILSSNLISLSFTLIVRIYLQAYK